MAEPSGERQAQPGPSRADASGRLGEITLCAAVLAFGAAHALTPANPRTGGTDHPDFLAGLASWSFVDKEVDVRLIRILLGGFVLCWFALLALARRGRLGRPPTLPARGLLFGVSAYVLTAAFLSPAFLSPELHLLTLLVAVWVVLHTLAPSADPPATARRLLLVALGLVVVFFDVLAATALVRTVRPALLLSLHDAWGALLFGVPAGFAVLASVWLAGAGDRAERSLARLLLAAQVPLPLALLGLISRGHTVGGQLRGGEVGAPFAALVVLAALLLAGLALRRVLRSPDEPPTPGSVLGWTSVVVIGCTLVWVRAGNPAPVLGTDWFHEAETYLPWHQLAGFGQVPYTEYVPLKGGSRLLYGLLNTVFHGDQYHPAPPYYVVLHDALIPQLLLVGGLLFSAARLLGTPWALLFALTLPPLAAPVLVYLGTVLVLLRLYERTGWFLAAWALLFPFNILFYPTYGVAAAAATGPLLLAKLIDLRRGDWREALSAQRGLLVGVGLVLFVGLVATHRIWLGYVGFLRDMSAAHHAGSGIAFLQFEGNSLSDAALGGRFAFELFRFGGWLLGLAFVGHALARLWIQGARPARQPDARRLVLGALSLVTFTLVLVPYVVGRIDPGVLGRSGDLSFLFLGLGIPLLLLRQRPAAGSLRTDVALGLLLATCASVHQGLHLGLLRERALELPAVREGHVSAEGLGIPRLRGIYVSPEQRRDLGDLKAVLDDVLREGETYLDLANHPLLYYLLDKRVPGTLSNDYNVTHPKLQRDFVRRLEDARIPLVLISPRRQLDGGSLALRSHYVYRWLMRQDLALMRRGRLVFLVAPDRLPKAAARLSRRDLLNRLVGLLSQTKLFQLPRSWGASLAQLRPLLRPAPTKLALTTTESLEQIPGQETLAFRALGRRPTITWRLEGPARGDDLAFLHLRIRTEGPGQTFQGRVLWDNELTDPVIRNSLSFQIASGEDLLIPVSANPTWLMSERVKSLRLVLDLPQPSHRYRIEAAELFSLAD